MAVLSPDRQRERLKGLTLVRVLLVTSFLGSAVAIDTANFGNLSDPRNITLLGLIISTYVLTIGYALGLRHKVSAPLLAHTQLAGDLVIAAFLTLVTGGFDSVFLFFFHLTIINAAIVAGQRAALAVAGLTALFVIYFAAITAGTLPHPILEIELATPYGANVIYEVLVNGFAGFLIALLAGQLAERLGQATEELERRKTDIAELRALNRNILSSISSGLLTVDDGGTIIFFNRAAEEITELPQSKVLGQPLEQLFPDLATVAAKQDLSEPDPRLESSFTRRDGQVVHLGFSLSPLRNSAGRQIGRIIIFQDLSLIKKMEAQVKRSERLAAVGELSAAIAHEIRNPLASISGSVEMLSRAESASEEDQILMDIVVREVDRLDHLITDFLDYSQPRALQTRAQPVVPIVEEVLRLFRARSDRAELTVELDLENANRACVDIDAESLRQVLWNLLRNAADVLADLPPARRTIHIGIDGTSASTPAVLISVEDDGPGIDAETAERIFEPFFTTKDEGTGLGLATSYRLLREQQATIELEAPIALRGARFELRLPRAAEDAESP